MKLHTIRAKAVQYRKRGYSYGMIVKKLGLPKSTLSNWLKELPYSPNKAVVRRIGLARSKSAQYKNRQKLASIKEARNLARKEIGAFTKRDFLIFGTSLYLGEGSKSAEVVQISNSNPRVIRFMVKWLEKVCGLKKVNFIIELHLYPDNNIEKSVAYWSKMTGVPEGQFSKTQIDKRQNKSLSKVGKLPYGTARLTVKSFGAKQFGVILHRRIMGWIEASLNQV